MKAREFQKNLINYTKSCYLHANYRDVAFGRAKQTEAGAST